MNAAMPDFLGQDLEAALLALLAPFVSQRFFVDVGAERGAFATHLLDLGLRGAMFEPLPRHYEALASLAAARGARAYPCAIDARDGFRELFVASDADGHELDYYHSLQRLDGDPRFRHGHALQVECRSLESLAADGTLPRAIGILKTDTEGHDLFVLQGLGGLRPELVVCEFFTEGVYQGWEHARPEPLVAHMRARGYARYLATKRVGEFEYCSASPTGFVPGQWGNLFFLSDPLFARAEDALSGFLAAYERRLMERMQAICDDRVAKEAVIQGLASR